MMVLVVLSFVLKTTFSGRVAVAALTLICGLFTALMWPVAIEQSRTQITAWLARPELMRDTAVLLCIDVALSVGYCFLAVHLRNSGTVKRSVVWGYRLLRLYPGLTVFMVLFSLLVTAVFSFPGRDFARVAWTLAAVVAVAYPLLVVGMKWLLPEKELRLELMFLLNLFIAMLAVVTTVNGTTAVEGTDEIEWLPMVACVALTLFGALAGWLIWRRRSRRPFKLSS